MSWQTANIAWFLSSASVRTMQPCHIAEEAMRWVFVLLLALVVMAPGGEARAEKRVALVMLNELMELGLDLEQIVQHRPKGILPGDEGAAADPRRGLIGNADGRGDDPAARQRIDCDYDDQQPDHFSPRRAQARSPVSQPCDGAVADSRRDSRAQVPLTLSPSSPRGEGRKRAAAGPGRQSRQ